MSGRRRLICAMTCLALLAGAGTAGAVEPTGRAARSAPSTANTLEALLFASAPSIRARLERRQAAPARAALARIAAAGHIPGELLRAVLANPAFTHYATRALVDLETVQQVPGVERVLTRIAQARIRVGARGGAFELEAGARLGPQVVEMGGLADGREADARLKNGTVVEVKHIDTHSPGKRVGHAIEQLLERKVSPDSRTMLIVNRRLSDQTVRRVENALGPNVKVFRTAPGRLVRLRSTR
jgi:hypothetical protein